MSAFFVLDSKGDVRIQGDLFVNADLSLGGNFIVGSGNDDLGSSSIFALGDNNIFPGLAQLLINGNNNEFSLGQNTVLGDFNTINGSNSLICGTNNQLIGGETNFICGTNILHNGNLGLNIGDSNERVGDLGATVGVGNENKGISNYMFGDNNVMNGSGDDNVFFSNNVTTNGFSRNIYIGKNIQVNNARLSSMVLAPNGCNPNSIYENPTAPGSGLVEPPVSNSLTVVAKNGIYMETGTAPIQSSLIKYSNDVDPIADIVNPSTVATKAYVDSLFPITNTTIYFEIPTAYPTIYDALNDGKTNLVVVSNITETNYIDFATLVLGGITQASIIINPNVVVSYEGNFPGSAFPISSILNTIYFDSSNTFQLLFQGQGTLRFATSPSAVNPGFFSAGLKFLSLNGITFEYLNASNNANSGIVLASGTQLRFYDLYIFIQGTLNNGSTPFVQSIGGGTFIENIILKCDEALFGATNHDFPIFDVLEPNTYFYNNKIIGTINSNVTNPVRLIQASSLATNLIINNFMCIASGSIGPIIINTELFIETPCTLSNITGVDKSPINLILRANDSKIIDCTLGGSNNGELGGNNMIILDNQFEYTSGAFVGFNTFTTSISDVDIITNNFNSCDLNLSGYDLTRVTIKQNIFDGSSLVSNSGAGIVTESEFAHNTLNNINFNINNISFSHFIGNRVLNGSLIVNCSAISNKNVITKNIITSTLIPPSNLEIGNSGGFQNSIINANLVKNNINLYISPGNNIIITSNRTINGTIIIFGGPATVNAQNL